MPIYEYKCKNCDSVLEVIQKFSDAPLTTHDGCGGELERLLGSPALQFKGAGWYVNDYAKGGRSKGKAEGASESKSESKSETKTESKPAAAKTD